MKGARLAGLSFAAVKKPAVIKAFGERLRQLREAKGWTLAELSDRAELGSATVFRAEKGLHALSLDALACLADAFGLSVSELLADADGGLQQGDAPA